MPRVGGVSNLEIAVAISGFNRVKHRAGVGDVFFEVSIERVT